MLLPGSAPSTGWTPWSRTRLRPTTRSWRSNRPGSRWYASESMSGGSPRLAAMDTVDVDDFNTVDADVRPDVEDRELVVDDGLDERQRQILAFERRWWKHAGSKEQA